MKKILAIFLAMTLLLSAQVFADENTATTTPPTTPATVVQPTPEAQPASAETITVLATAAVQPGITPDSLLYGLDKLIERIQLSLITDSVAKAEELAKISQERLAESRAMLEKSDIELSQKALDEYKANLEQAVELVEAALESGKQVADVMNEINHANLKDAAVVEKILASVPEEFRVEVKVEIEKLAAAADAVNDTAQVVENKAEEDGLKQDITLKLLEEKIKDAALLAKIKAEGLNTRQIIAVLSLSEQTEKPLAEVLDLFLENEKGLGATAHALGLPTKDALKGINSSFKDAKSTIKQAFKEAIKIVEDDEKEEVEALVASSLAGQTAAAEVQAVNKKLVQVVKEAKLQVKAITAEAENKKAEKDDKKAVKELEKLEKKVEKAIEKLEKKTITNKGKAPASEKNDHNKVEKSNKKN